MARPLLLLLVLSSAALADPQPHVFRPDLERRAGIERRAGGLLLFAGAALILTSLGLGLDQATHCLLKSDPCRSDEMYAAIGTLGVGIPVFISGIAFSVDAVVQRERSYVPLFVARF